MGQYYLDMADNGMYLVKSKTERIVVGRDKEWALKMVERYNNGETKINDERKAHYDAWASGKKWVRIEVEELVEGGWGARTVSEEINECVLRDTRQQAIYALSGILNNKGIEISNLAEIQGIKQ